MIPIGPAIAFVSIGNKTIRSAAMSRATTPWLMIQTACAGPRVMDLSELTEELVQQGLGDAGAEDGDLHSRVVDRVEREVIAQVMAMCDHVQIKAAARLGINRNTLHKKLKQYGLDGESAE